MTQIQKHRSVCPHDCPGACALEVEVQNQRVVSVKGAKAMPYTDGVICAKVGRYAERVHHAGRLTQPLIRTGAKGEAQFAPVGWDEALDRVATVFCSKAQEYGAETVWPYHYAGTMGLVQRDGIERLTHAMGYSKLRQTICSSIGKAGLVAGFGVAAGTDPLEMVNSELIVVWGMNPVFTQVNVMSHISKARKNGAKLVVIDPQRTATAEKADLHLPVRPGTDGALACAVMQVLLTEGLADRAFLRDRTDFDPSIEAHLVAKTPEWAASITGLSSDLIRDFAREYGETKRSMIRTGYGLTRSRNGACRLHAISCLPAVSGAWRYQGGGFLGSTSAGFRVDAQLITGSDLRSEARTLDMSQLGRVLAGDAEALSGGPPVSAMLVQSSNPAVVAPEQALVKQGFLRDDLFLCVHEQFMTDTAKYADVVLPATTFLEHEDLYTSYGHSFLQLAKPVLQPLAEARPNHDVIQGLAQRLGAQHSGFSMSAHELIEETLQRSGYPNAEALDQMGWYNAGKEERAPNFRERFGTDDGRFRFRPDWSSLGDTEGVMPALPDHWENRDRKHPFRLVPGPARNFLNSTFTETDSSQRKEKRPTVSMHPSDSQPLGIRSGDVVVLGNDLGEIRIHAEVSETVHPGLLVVPSVWPSTSFLDGRGINYLTSADVVLPMGGAPFHDTSVWIRSEKRG